MKSETELWLSMATRFFKRETLEKMLKERGVLPQEVWLHIEPISQHFFRVVTGKSQFKNIAGASEAVCINRILKTPLTSLSLTVSQRLTAFVCNTFYLGMLTQLFVFDGVARSKCKMVDLEKILNKWEIVSTNAEIALGKHGGQSSGTIKQIYLVYFESEVKPFLIKELNMGGFTSLFRMGKFENFFENLYYAGMGLALRCEVEAQDL